MIFDFSDGDTIMPMGDRMGMDSQGNLNIRIGKNSAMDMNTGSIHFTSSWNTDDEPDQFSPLGNDGLFGRKW